MCGENGRESDVCMVDVHYRERGKMAHLVDHILKLSLGGVLSQRSHNGTKLLSRDSSITIYIHQPSSPPITTRDGLTFVKERECLFELWLLAHYPNRSIQNPAGEQGHTL